MRSFLESSAIWLAVLAGSSSPAASEQVSKGARLVTWAQYQCLVRYADRLRVSRRGNTIDLSACPKEPSVLLPAFPLPPSSDRMFLKPNELACIRKSRAGERMIAVRQRDGKVALYLDPCRT